MSDGSSIPSFISVDLVAGTITVDASQAAVGDEAIYSLQVKHFNQDFAAAQTDVITVNLTPCEITSASLSISLPDYTVFDAQMSNDFIYTQ